MSRRQPKTLLMQLLEERHPGQTIETLMLNAFREHRNERAAAETLGITQQTFNLWKFRLGLDQQMETIAQQAGSQTLGLPIHPVSSDGK
jgi:hypothetical protein